MDEDDKRKTAPPGAVNLNNSSNNVNSVNNNNNSNVVKPPLRSSMMARSSTVSASDNSLLNKNNIPNGTTTTTTTTSTNSQRTNPPVRSASMIVKNSTDSTLSTPVQPSQQQQTTTTIQQPLNSEKKIPPKVTPRTSLSSLSINKVPVGQHENNINSNSNSSNNNNNNSNNNLNIPSNNNNNINNKSPTQSRISVSVNNNNNNNNNNQKNENLITLSNSNSLESIGDNSSEGSELLNKYLNDETNDAQTIDEDEDDTDDEEVEEEEELHDQFLKEMVGNQETVNALKEQERKEMELLAGGTKFRVTRSFVGIQSHSQPNKTGSLFEPYNRVSIINPTTRPISIINNNNNNNSNKPPIGPNQSTQNSQQTPPQQLSGSPTKSNGSNLQIKTQNGKVMNNPRISVMIHQRAPPRKPLPPTPPRSKPMPNLQENPVMVKAAIKIQRAYRRYKQCLPLIKLKLLYRYRWNIVQEIYNTEKTYLSTLKQLSTHFIEPLRKSNLIGQEDVKFIFGGIDSIYVINNTLLSDIEKVLDKWTPYSVLGSCFTTMGVYLKAYTDYVKNFDFGLQRISQCAKDSKFAAFIKSAEEKTTPRSRLESLLITPVQRIPRYVLLLQDLLKHTEESHPDFQHLTKALELVKNIAMSINDTKRQSDNSLKVVEVQNKLIGKCPNLVIAERRYVFEGYLLVGDLYNKSKRVYVFLFNDILIFSKPTTNKIFNNKSKFKFLKCEDLFPCPMLTDIPNNPSMINCFEILLQNVELRFFAESPESKSQWLANLQRVFNDIGAQQQQNEKLVNYKKAEEKANDFKKYIDFQYTALKLKGKTGRGATLATGSMNLSEQDSSGDLSNSINGTIGNNSSSDNLIASGSDLDTNVVNDTQQQNIQQQNIQQNNSNSSSPQQSSPQLQSQINNQQSSSPQLRQYPNLLRQTTFHKMSYQTRMETIKDAEEKTQQLLLEEQKNQELLVKQTNEENKKVHKEQLNEIYKGATVGRSFFKSSSGTIVGGNGSSNNSPSGNNPVDDDNSIGNNIPQKYDTVKATKSTGAPSLNKIFSNFSTSSKALDKEKDKEKEKDDKKKTMQVQKSSLNLKALNSELAQINNNKKQ